MDWRWESGSVLYSERPDVPPREIFQAVCNELGRYYTMQGKKYTKSRPAIKWTGDRLAYKVAFWSSHSNMRGQWVCMEIVLSAYARLAEGMEKKGYIYIPVDRELPPDNRSSILVKRIGEPTMERSPKEREKPAILYSNTCNIARINQSLFEEIIAYIDFISQRARQFEQKDKIDQFLKTLPEDYWEYFWSFPNNRVYYERLSKGESL